MKGEREKFLLIGNGLNLTLEGEVSWGNLLKDIADEYDIEYNPSLPLPLEFERILNSYLEKNTDTIVSKSVVIRDFKNKVAEITSKAQLSPEAIHYELHSLNIDGVLTTNYDCLIEKVFDPSYIYDGSSTKKYLFEPTSYFDHKKFYHIHGISGCNQSICLGYEHYMGVVEKTREAINKKKDGKIYEMQIKRILYGEEKECDYSYEKFYTADIAIVGLGLNTSEFDLWWLLTHRAYLINSDYAKLSASGKLNNRIIYYEIINNEKTEEQRNKISLLRALNVEVREFDISVAGDYYGAYKRIFRDIRDSF